MKPEYASIKEQLPSAILSFAGFSFVSILLLRSLWMRNHYVVKISI
jgi:hypothetical protein